jgi:hypothetical protein
MIRKMVSLSTKNYISILPFTIKLKVLSNNVLYLDEIIPRSVVAKLLVATLSYKSFLKIIGYVSLTRHSAPLTHVLGYLLSPLLEQCCPPPLMAQTNVYPSHHVPSHHVLGLRVPAPLRLCVSVPKTTRFMPVLVCPLPCFWVSLSIYLLRPSPPIMSLACVSLPPYVFVLVCPRPLISCMCYCVPPPSSELQNPVPSCPELQYPVPSCPELQYPVPSCPELQYPRPLMC